ncbi:AzlD domain-containing protein [Oceanimonas pelagia]|uniref:AzlD domain-containing protein n=1 Tax=Oceanimonas pelagia TaxID=3028314 RepID=A0AA50KRD3_9GAMM|nr:AzlD domain-containing protein [Oceanimonas pelagia]WMC11667.1 AzlD domain-containing protein [Oceanimonas pelagia]
MNSVELWLLFVGVGIGTFAIRLSFIQLHGSLSFNMAKCQKVFSLLAPAVLAALSVPAIIFQQGNTMATQSGAQLVAAAVTALWAWYSKGVFWPLMAGMGTFWLIKFYYF